MRSKNAPASLRGSRKTFPLIPFGREGFARNAALPRRGVGGAIARSDCGGRVIPNFGLRLLEDRASYIGRPIREDRSASQPIMRRQLPTAERTVNPGGCLLREEGRAMIVFDLCWLQVWISRPSRRSARPPAASGLTQSPPPSKRPPSHQCRRMRKRIQRPQNAS